MISFGNHNFVEFERCKSTLYAAILQATSYGEHCNFRLAILFPSSHFRTSDQPHHANFEYCFSVLHLLCDMFHVALEFTNSLLPQPHTRRCTLICSPVRAVKKTHLQFVSVFTAAIPAAWMLHTPTMLLLVLLFVRFAYFLIPGFPAERPMQRKHGAKNTPKKSVAFALILIWYSHVNRYNLCCRHRQYRSLHRRTPHSYRMSIPSRCFATCAARTFGADLAAGISAALLHWNSHYL